MARVLIIEDEAPCCSFAKSVGRSGSYEILTASSLSQPRR
jgi:hypothetical protein